MAKGDVYNSPIYWTRDAKQVARQHRGSYKQDFNLTGVDLWDHVLFARIPDNNCFGSRFYCHELPLWLALYSSYVSGQKMERAERRWSTRLAGGGLWEWTNEWQRASLLPPPLQIALSKSRLSLLKVITVDWKMRFFAIAVNVGQQSSINSIEPFTFICIDIISSFRSGSVSWLVYGKQVLWCDGISPLPLSRVRRD